MSIRTALALAIGALTLALAVNRPAMAKKKSHDAELPSIEATGISAFDDVFNQVSEIQATLTGSRNSLDKANEKIVEAVGLGHDATVAEALDHLNQKAGDALTVTMSGEMPTLSVSDAAPDDVKKAVSDINAAVKDKSATVTELRGLLPQSQALVEQSSSFPGKVPSAVKDAGLKMTDVPKVAKKVKNDCEATRKTPGMVKDLIAEGDATLDAVKSIKK